MVLVALNWVQWGVFMYTQPCLVSRQRSEGKHGAARLQSCSVAAQLTYITLCKYNANSLILGNMGLFPVFVVPFIFIAAVPSE